MQARTNVHIEEDALGNVEVPADHDIRTWIERQLYRPQYDHAG